MTKKLSGLAANSASWATSVGNEKGQVLNTVLTTSEDLEALEPLAAGLVKRYARADQPPPAVLYTDRDCCRVGGGRSRLHDLFGAWSDLMIRLDIWHFMRRFAIGVTSTSHPLYGALMSGISACIFEWDSGDVALLERAKRAQLKAGGVTEPSPAAVRLAITRGDLARHCRRRTAGVHTTTDKMEALLLELADATDMLGTPLMKAEMRDIWAEQRRHIPCLQDPEGVELYTRTGSSIMGGIKLPVYRCARGTTGLESFHLHLARFIPGQLCAALNSCPNNVTFTTLLKSTFWRLHCLHRKTLPGKSASELCSQNCKICM